ncbi:hypothetical protein [Spirosoma endbachense]|uniref:DUF2306 domain-containing protein n=1 Tax=Spirosoma endbachense TaxID=2666025 RepID=A0A6P1VQC6_9BACT|nr:hypothetical protein [Spirosoma endbachense]QHV94322.1 hypothetical protein GJR95_04490 [Spirosoma endbachense]
MEKAYRHISYLFIAVLLLIFCAFFKTYFGLFPGFTGTATLVHVHAVTVLLWFAMLIGQPILIRTKQIALHRLVGKVSYLLVPLMVISFLLISRRHQLRGKDLMMFAANFSDISLFIVLYGLAIIYRHPVTYHARFMIMTVLPFLGASVGRLPNFPISSALLGLFIILGLLLFERFTRRIYRPYLISLAVFMGLLIVPYSFLLFAPSLLDKLWYVCFG